MQSFSIVCDVCGATNQIGRAYCVACGYSLVASSKDVSAFSTHSSFVGTGVLKQRYRLVSFLGEGGMGTVYIGQDMQLGNRSVAIKEMSQDGLSARERLETARNFQREAHLLASLQHPNLPDIYDHFEEDQRWYLVMSFIQGQSLAEYLAANNGQLSVEEVIEIGIILCTVLSYLHNHQPPIIFRDLKPSNIMRSSDGHIYLIDFGIARLFKTGKIRDTTDYGSPGYAPPEQYGNAQTTPRADVYSLGVTLYQMLSGYEPANSPFRLPPIQAFVPTIPPAFVLLLSKMLDLEESKRPYTMDIVRQELQDILSEIRTKSSEKVVSRARDKEKRNKKKVAGISLSIFLLIIISSSIFLYHPLINKPELINSTQVYTTKNRVIHSDSPIVETKQNVVTTFCDALNAQSPDFQRAYQQLSSNYQKTHSQDNFQLYFQGTVTCTVVNNVVDGNNTAQIRLLIVPCPPGPPPPNGAVLPPPPSQPPPREPPRATNLMSLTLVDSATKGWKIDDIGLVNQVCTFPSGGAPPP